MMSGMTETLLYPLLIHNPCSMCMFISHVLFCVHRWYPVGKTLPDIHVMRFCFKLKVFGTFSAKAGICICKKNHPFRSWEAFLMTEVFNSEKTLVFEERIKRLSPIMKLFFHKSSKKDDLNATPFGLW